MENGTGEGTALKIVSLLVEKARGEWLSNNSAEHSHSLRAFISESNNFFFPILFSEKSNASRVSRLVNGTKF